MKLGLKVLQFKESPTIQKPSRFDCPASIVFPATDPPKVTGKLWLLIQCYVTAKGKHKILLLGPVAQPDEGKVEWWKRGVRWG